MGKFKTNFKDEIATRIYKIIDTTANAIIHDKVRIEHNYTPTQEGDKVGAAWFNDVGERLNNIEDGTEAVKKASNVPWSGVTNKPSTYPPSTHSHTKSQISDFPSSLPANGGDADTLKGFSFKNSATAGQPTYVPGFAGGAPAPMPMYNPSTWSVRYATDAGSVGGWKFALGTTVVNPAGSNIVYVPLYSGRTRDDTCFPIILNGNWDAASNTIKGKSIQGGTLILFLDKGQSGGIQFNILWVYK